MNNSRNELLEMSMGKLFKKLAVPGMIGMLAVGLYNFVDAIFVGQFVGAAGVGAIMIGYNIVLINQALFTLFSTGAMSVLSRAMGEQDQKTIDKLLGTVLICVAVLSVLFSVIVYNKASSFLTFLGGSGEILVLGERYIKIIALGFIFGGVGPALNMLIRGEGKMKAAMKIIVIGTVSNIILDPIFIKVLGMGIEGAAIATLIAQIIYLIFDFIYFRSGESVIKISKNTIKPYFDIVPQILSVGFSGMLMQLMAALQLGILLRALSSYGGNDSIIIMGAAYRVLSFAFIPLWGISQGLQPLLGANYGAHCFDRVKKGFLYFTKIATYIAGTVWICFMLFPRLILSWFITDPALVQWGIPYFRIILCIFVLYGFMVCAIIFFQALGKGGKAAVLVMGRQILFFIPIVLILPRFIGELGVWTAMPFGDFLTVVLALILAIGEFIILNKKMKLIS